MIRFATIGTSAIVDRFLEAAALCEGLVHTAVFSRKKETAKAFGQPRHLQKSTEQSLFIQI